MSTFGCPVVHIDHPPQRHPDADTLSVTQVAGENVVFKTGAFAAGDLAVYIPVNAIVPESVPGTEFLGQNRRIKAIRLRGVYSEGLLLPMSVLSRPLELGEDAAGPLGVIQHEDTPPESMRPKGSGRGSSEQASPPVGVPRYDVEQLARQLVAFEPGADVVVTEKLHGTQARYAFMPWTGLQVGSHNCWWKNDCRPPSLMERIRWVWGRSTNRPVPPERPTAPNLYWGISRQYRLGDSLRRCMGICLYGEIYGPGVQDLSYDAELGTPRLRVFEAFNTVTGEWLDHSQLVAMCARLGVSTVPVLYRGPYRSEVVDSLVDGPSTLAGHLREGVVVKPSRSRREHGSLKVISRAYKLRKNGTEYH